MARRASASTPPVGTVVGRMSRDPRYSRATTASESAAASQKTSAVGRCSPSMRNAPRTGPTAKPSGLAAPNVAVAVPTRPSGVTSRSAASMTPVFPSWRPTRSMLTAICHGAVARAMPAKTTASTIALRAITARRLYLSAHTPQRGTRKIPNTKMRLLNSPVNVGMSRAARPTSASRSGR